MKLSWTEPWSKERIRRDIRAVSKEIPSVRKISIWSGVLAFASMAGVRYCLPGSEEVLTWGLVASVTLICASFVLSLYFAAIFPSIVHITEKGVSLQHGSGGSLFARDIIRSISFEDRDDLHLFVVRGKTKRGKDFERTAVASDKISDAEVEQFLFDVGLAHLYRKGEIA